MILRDRLNMNRVEEIELSEKPEDAVEWSEEVPVGRSTASSRGTQRNHRLTWETSIARKIFSDERCGQQGYDRELVEGRTSFDITYESFGSRKGG